MNLAQASYEASLVREKQEQEQRQRQHEEDKKNSDFVQFYRNHLDMIAELGASNPTALKLLLFLIKHMDGTNALCVSATVLADLLDCSRMTVSRAVKYLKDNGWLCVLKTGTANVYIVNPEVAWTSYGYQKQYCKFNATVLLGSDENAEFLQNKRSFDKFKTIDTDFVKTAIENRKPYRSAEDFINGTE